MGGAVSRKLGRKANKEETFSSVTVPSAATETLAAPPRTPVASLAAAPVDEIKEARAVAALPQTKVPRAQDTDRDPELEALRKEVAALRSQIEALSGTYYASSLVNRIDYHKLNESGLPAFHVLEFVRQAQQLDFQPRLNTSSYVNVVFEPEEEQVALLGLKVNIADQTVYPESFRMHNSVLNVIGNLWHCPRDETFDEYGCFPGAGTVGSTEACLLAGLALKFRWRKWYAAQKGLTEEHVRGICPNLVIASTYQACWEKFFKYMDVEPKLVSPSVLTSTLSAADVLESVDEKTIGVICILGNHYGGQYDPVWDIDEAISSLNAEKGWQVGIHVDGASGGFTAPFQPTLKAWDFRLPNVLSISVSGHKFGQSCCGTGWVIWRRRADLSEHIAISVSYLGGKADSFTLNFSRPASGIYVQMYKLLRLGRCGYKQLCDNMMEVAAYIRSAMKAMTYEGLPRFTMMDHGDIECLPVVAARLNTDLGLEYDDIDLQHAIGESHWYICGYKMSYKHPITEKTMPLFHDASAEGTMMRIVVKANLTLSLADNLLRALHDTLEKMDRSGAGYAQLHSRKIMEHRANLGRHHSIC